MQTPVGRICISSAQLFLMECEYKLVDVSENVIIVLLGNLPLGMMVNVTGFVWRGMDGN